VSGTTDGLPEPPDAVGEVFGDRSGLARRYADLLAGDGVVRGLIGPREVPRLWSRHLLNCAAVTELVPRHARVVDVGSGAGLPGVVIALRRADLRVDLVEPTARRVAFLDETVAALGLSPQVRVIRGRAEERTVRAAVGGADVVTARAVAPLDRLVRWCLPLLRPAGLLVALKGAAAEQELATAAPVIRQWGGLAPAVQDVGSGEAVARVVAVRRRGHETTERTRARD